MEKDGLNIPTSKEKEVTLAEIPSAFVKVESIDPEDYEQPHLQNIVMVGMDVPRMVNRTTDKYKSCYVPMCNNTTVRTPNKLFITVTTDTSLRKRWHIAAGGRPPVLYSKSLHCCEDHFDVAKDVNNFMECKLMGNRVKPRLKKGVVPHRFDCQRVGLMAASVQLKQTPVLILPKKDLVEETLSGIKTIYEPDSIIIKEELVSEESEIDQFLDERSSDHLQEILEPSNPSKALKLDLNDPHSSSDVNSSNKANGNSVDSHSPHGNSTVFEDDRISMSGSIIDFNPSDSEESSFEIEEDNRESCEECPTIQVKKIDINNCDDFGNRIFKEEKCSDEEELMEFENITTEFRDQIEITENPLTFGSGIVSSGNGCSFIIKKEKESVQWNDSFFISQQADEKEIYLESGKESRRVEEEEEEDRRMNEFNSSVDKTQSNTNIDKSDPETLRLNLSMTGVREFKKPLIVEFGGNDFVGKSDVSNSTMTTTTKKRPFKEIKKFKSQRRIKLLEKYSNIYSQNMMILNLRRESLRRESIHHREMYQLRKKQLELEKEILLGSIL